MVENFWNSLILYQDSHKSRDHQILDRRRRLNALDFFRWRPSGFPRCLQSKKWKLICILFRWLWRACEEEWDSCWHRRLLTRCSEISCDCALHSQLKKSTEELYLRIITFSVNEYFQKIIILDQFASETFFPRRKHFIVKVVYNRQTRLFVCKDVIAEKKSALKWVKINEIASLREKNNRNNKNHPWKFLLYNHLGSF